MTAAIDLTTLTLAKGAHQTREDGVCLMEAVAWFAGQEHTDHPPGVSPVLARFGRSWNDALPDGRRHILIPFIPLLPGTAGDGHYLTRSYLALDWLAREYAPAFLALVPALAPHAGALRGLAPLRDPGTVQAARPVITAAGAAAGDAARDAAWDAAWAAAGDAAGDAAGAAARDAARAAARDAARAAARDAARDAASDALAPTVAALQDSAIALYQAMITPGGAP
jgi:hypothetical protein